MPARIDPASLPKFPGLVFENSLWKQGLTKLGGVDEAGRGSWAGPVTAAVVILPAAGSIKKRLRGVRDSKQMTSIQREKWALTIQEICPSWSVGFASAAEIDEIGIIPATRLAVQRALEKLSCVPDHLLMDYLLLPDIAIPQTSLIKGDRRSLSIAAASVLAKSCRDAHMRRLDEDLPGYDFGQHKGYGTQRHREAIRKMGLCPIHRKSYKFQRN
ncbi:ribonuclease HII [Chloroflexota bacterium]